MASEEEVDALVADLDEAEVIDVIYDAMGDKVKVGRLRGAVLIGAQGSPGILDTPERREQFARAWTEACRRADGEPHAAEAREPSAAEIDRCHESTDAFHRCRVCVADDEL